MKYAPQQQFPVIDLCHVGGGGGGVDRILLRTARCLSNTEFASTICCIRREGDQAFDLDRRAAEAGVDYCEVTERSAFDRTTWRTLQLLVEERRPCIVHAHQYKATYFAWRLAQTPGVIPLVTCHGWTGNHWRERQVYYPLERKLICRFPQAIAVSSNIRNTLIRSGSQADRVQVLLNGIDPSAFQRDTAVRARIRAELGCQTGDVLLGAAGRLERQKRFDLLLEAVAILSKTHPQVRLLIAGDGQLRGALHEQIRRMGLEGRCQLLGYRADVAELFQAFDVMVQSSDYEGTPTVVVEAMALQIPVVATDAGGTAELATHGEHALIVPCRNPLALALAIASTLDQPIATAARVSAARQRVEGELSFDNRTQQLAAIYRALINRNVTTATSAAPNRAPACLEGVR